MFQLTKSLILASKVFRVKNFQQTASHKTEKKPCFKWFLHMKHRHRHFQFKFRNNLWKIFSTYNFHFFKQVVKFSREFDVDLLGKVNRLMVWVNCTCLLLSELSSFANSLCDSDSNGYVIRRAVQQKKIL